MWNRETKPGSQPTAAAPIAAAPFEPVQPQPVPVAPAPTAATATYAPPAKAKGSTLVMKGELSGAEDLVLEGKVEGKISLPDHVLTIGLGAEVSAEIQARVIVLHGHVTGNAIASERMEIKSSGRMQGDLITPRVMMADGATFNGRLETRVPGKGTSAKSKQAELVAV
jgi:cytoskeletal protein CcmA (bactofilin family)